MDILVNMVEVIPVKRCPNCSYMLVLVKRESKYKCAKCDRIFSRMDIENKAFQDWNRKEREKARESAKKGKKYKKLLLKLNDNPQEQQKSLVGYT